MCNVSNVSLCPRPFPYIQYEETGKGNIDIEIDTDIDIDTDIIQGTIPAAPSQRE